MLGMVSHKEIGFEQGWRLMRVGCKTLSALACLFALLVFASPVAASIFGDGDPGNGVEDNRIDMSSPLWNDAKRSPWNMGAGTIHCDGQNRGSAMIVDTAEFGGLQQGLIVATSAHVLFDLQKKRLFSACQFHYMALDHLPGYQAEIRLGKSRIGSFDPSRAKNSLVFGKEDWAFLFVDGYIPGISQTGSLQIRPFRTHIPAMDRPVRYQFIAYSKSLGSISISTACEVKESRSDDLGGGSWPGQLLDNCDSEGGASGGGLIASIAGKHYLVGIRSGAHWDGDVFPSGEFPDGPPDGARWDTLVNTNFGRAIDWKLVESLNSLVQEINDSFRKGSIF